MAAGGTKRWNSSDGRGPLAGYPTATTRRPAAANDNHGRLAFRMLGQHPFRRLGVIMTLGLVGLLLDVLTRWL